VFVQLSGCRHLGFVEIDGRTAAKAPPMLALMQGQLWFALESIAARNEQGQKKYENQLTR
jgi:hypothetical protein